MLACVCVCVGFSEVCAGRYWLLKECNYCVWRGEWGGGRCVWCAWMCGCGCGYAWVGVGVSVYTHSVCDYDQTYVTLNVSVLTINFTIRFTQFKAHQYHCQWYQ